MDTWRFKYLHLMAACVMAPPLVFSFVIHAENNEYKKQDIIDSLTKSERQLIFGGDDNHNFEILYPKWSPIKEGKENSMWKHFYLKSPEMEYDIILQNSNQFLSPYMSVTPPKKYWKSSHRSELPSNIVRKINGDCHWRFVNSTYVITVDECHPKGIHALIITRKSMGVLYPLQLSEKTMEVNGKLHPHIWHHTSERFLSDLQYEHQKVIRKRRLRRDKKMSAEIPRNDFPVLSRSNGINELEFEVVNVDLESDLEKFRVNNSGYEYIIEPSWASPVTGDVQVVLRKTVEIAIFCDSSLVENFGANLEENDKITLTRYIEILVNALEGIYHQEELGGYIIDLKLVHIGLLQSNEGPTTFDGEVGNYLRAFSTWQELQNPGTDLNPAHWDHAIMLSGLNLRSGGNPGVIGLAWVSGMCHPQLSSTLNEGGSFLSLYVVAHEMGHNIGMDHDGSNAFISCNAQNHIMSPSVGAGKTTWSPCSIQVVQQFLRQSTCLNDGESGFSSTSFPSSTQFPTQSSTVRPPRPSPTRTSSPTMSSRPTTELTSPSPPTTDIDKIKANLPGQIFPPMQQCKLALGPTARPVINSPNDMCAYLVCETDRSIRGIHPALQGSSCGNGNICIAGSCKPEEELRRLIVLFRDVFNIIDSQ